MNKVFELSKELAFRLLPLIILLSLVIIVNTKQNDGATLKSLDYAHAVIKRGELFRSHSLLTPYRFQNFKTLQILAPPPEQVKSLSVNTPSIGRNMKSILQGRERLAELTDTVEHGSSPFLKLRFYRM